MGGDRLVAAVAGDDVEREHGDEIRSAWIAEYGELRNDLDVVLGSVSAP